MMLPILLFILILLLPVSSLASYMVYLKNGSVISGVSSYEKRDGEIHIFFGGGSMGISEEDILKIEETETPEKDFRLKEIPGKPEEAPPAAPPPAETIDKSSRVNALKGELESVNSEIKTVEADEARLVKSINERKGARLSYNVLQLRKLESDLAPLQQELSDIQVKKGALLQRKATIEGELRALE